MTQMGNVLISLMQINHKLVFKVHSIHSTYEGDRSHVILQNNQPFCIADWACQHSSSGTFDVFFGIFFVSFFVRGCSTGPRQAAFQLAGSPPLSGGANSIDLSDIMNAHLVATASHQQFVTKYD